MLLHFLISVFESTKFLGYLAGAVIVFVICVRFLPQLLTAMTVVATSLGVAALALNLPGMLAAIHPAAPKAAGYLLFGLCCLGVGLVLSVQIIATIIFVYIKARGLLKRIAQ